jgi:hypothetical protein
VNLKDIYDSIYNNDYIATYDINQYYYESDCIKFKSSDESANYFQTNKIIKFNRDQQDLAIIGISFPADKLWLECIEQEEKNISCCLTANMNIKNINLIEYSFDQKKSGVNIEVDNITKLKLHQTIFKKHIKNLRIGIDILKKSIKTKINYNLEVRINLILLNRLLKAYQTLGLVK